jgi:hypothetical protein
MSLAFAPLRRMPSRTKKLLAVAAATVVPQLIMATRGYATTSVTILSYSLDGGFGLHVDWDTVGLTYTGVYPHPPGAIMSFFMCENSTSGPFTFLFTTSNDGELDGEYIGVMDTGVDYNFYCQDLAGDTSGVFGISVP